MKFLGASVELEKRDKQGPSLSELTAMGLDEKLCRSLIAARPVLDSLEAVSRNELFGADYYGDMPEYRFFHSAIGSFTSAIRSGISAIFVGDELSLVSSINFAASCNLIARSFLPEVYEQQAVQDSGDHLLLQMNRTIAVLTSIKFMQASHEGWSLDWCLRGLCEDYSELIESWHALDSTYVPDDPKAQEEHQRITKKREESLKILKEYLPD